MKGIGRVTFMAHLAEITAELDAGASLKAIHENHRDRLGISYSQFVNYVDRIIRHRARNQAPLPPQPARPEPAVQRGSTASAETSHAAHRAPRSFNHDPVERPDDRRRLLGED